MKNRKYLAVSLLIALAMAGCASDKTKSPGTSEGGGKDGTAETSPSGDKSGSSATPLKGQKNAELLSQRRVYFAFDSSAIDDEGRAIIEAHAAQLANSQTKVTLEGNGDERGTREYNLALGERRAQSVERMMKVLGVAGNRIKVVSYGEEKGLCQEHNESCWRQNRRVEISY